MVFKMDFYDDYIWMSPSYIHELKSDTYINGTKVLAGSYNHCNITLSQDANLEIIGNFTGRLIGLGNNIVRIKGTFIGVLSCEKLIVLNGGKVEGSLWVNKIVIKSNSGCSLNGNVNNGELTNT